MGDSHAVRQMETARRVAFSLSSYMSLPVILEVFLLVGRHPPLNPVVYNRKLAQEKGKNWLWSKELLNRREAARSDKQGRKMKERVDKE